MELVRNIREENNFHDPLSRKTNGKKPVSKKTDVQEEQV